MIKIHHKIAVITAICSLCGLFLISGVSLAATNNQNIPIQQLQAQPKSQTQTQEAQAQTKTLLIATTSSTDNTGLMDYLSPKLKQDTNIKLKWISTGTGKAMLLGKNCDVDALLVHSPAVEKKFIRDGYGVDRTQIMYNEFILVGPSADPAKIRGLIAPQAFKAIAEFNAPVNTQINTKVTDAKTINDQTINTKSNKNNKNDVQTKIIFVSRGDESGTHNKEKELWQNISVKTPEQATWYIQSGQGMMATLEMAAEKQAYTLTDRATFIKYQSHHSHNRIKPALEVMVEASTKDREDNSLKNQYSIVITNPQRCPKTAYAAAQQFKDWMVSTKIQTTINQFTLLGKQLFFANAH